MLAQLYFNPSVPATWTDYYSTATMAPDSTNSARMYVRYQDSQNYYMCDMTSKGGGLYLVKVVNGTTTGLANAPFSYQPGAFYVVRMGAKGTSLNCSVYTQSGTLVASTSASDSAIAAGRTAITGYYYPGSFSSTQA